jgi:pimeloyl-ACP methyl ester carboxylesterase
VVDDEMANSSESGVGVDNTEIEHILAAPDGTRLAYWLRRADAASDRLLLLLHGAASNHTRWSEFVERTWLVGTWSVLRPDLRGNGASQTRARQNLAVWCDDVHAILAAQRFPCTVVIGHSLGAQIAVHLAHRYPEDVRGLVLIDPVFQRGLRGRPRVFRRYRWLFRCLTAVVLALNRLGFRRRGFPHRDLRLLDAATRQALRGDEPFQEIARRYSALRPILKHMPTANYLRQGLATVSPLPPLAEIGVPVLVLLSKGITFGELAINREEAAGFPDSEVRLLDANHWPLTEAPDAVREAIEEWVERRFPSHAA